MLTRRRRSRWGQRCNCRTARWPGGDKHQMPLVIYSVSCCSWICLHKWIIQTKHYNWTTSTLKWHQSHVLRTASLCRDRFQNLYFCKDNISVATKNCFGPPTIQVDQNQNWVKATDWAQKDNARSLIKRFYETCSREKRCSIVIIK